MFVHNPLKEICEAFEQEGLLVSRQSDVHSTIMGRDWKWVKNSSLEEVDVLKRVVLQPQSVEDRSKAIKVLTGLKEHAVDLSKGSEEHTTVVQAQEFLSQKIIDCFRQHVGDDCDSWGEIKSYVMDNLNSLKTGSDWIQAFELLQVLKSANSTGVSFDPAFRALGKQLDRLTKFGANIDPNLQKTLDSLNENRQIISLIGLQYAGENLKKDREFVLDYVKRDGSALQYAIKNFPEDREIAFAAVAQNGSAFEFVGELMRGNREFALAAIKQKADAFRFISESLKNDRDFVLAAVIQNSAALTFVSQAFKGDREFILDAVKQNGMLLRVVPANWRSDREIVLAAVKQCSLAFKEASEILRGDREIALAAIVQDENCFSQVSPSLQRDREFLLGAVQQNGLILVTAGRNWQGDREVFSAAVKQNPSVLIKLGLQNNAAVLLGLIKDLPSILQFAGDVLKRNREFLLAAVAQNSAVLEHVGRDFQTDRAFILDVVAQNIETLPLIGEAFQSDRSFFLDLVTKNGSALQFLSEFLRGDREFLLAAITQNPSVFQLASEAWQGNRDFILSVVKQNGSALQYVKEEFKRDREVILAAVTQDSKALTFVAVELRSPRDFVLELVKANGLTLQYMDEGFQCDREIALAAMGQKYKAYSYIGQALKEDRAFALEAMAKNLYILAYVAETFTADKSFALDAVEQNGAAIEFLSEELQCDRDVVLAATPGYPRALFYNPGFWRDPEFLQEISKILPPALYRDLQAEVDERLGKVGRRISDENQPSMIYDLLPIPVNLKSSLQLPPPPDAFTISAAGDSMRKFIDSMGEWSASDLKAMLIDDDFKSTLILESHRLRLPLALETLNPVELTHLKSAIVTTYRENLRQLIDRIQQREEYLSLPKNPETREAFYQQMETHLRRTCSLLSEKPLREWALEWLHTFSVGFHCAGAVSHLSQLSRQLLSNSASSFESELAQKMDEESTVAIEKMVEPYHGDVHVRNGLMSFLGDFLIEKTIPDHLYILPDNYRANFFKQINPLSLVLATQKAIAASEELQLSFENYLVDQRPAEYNAAHIDQVSKELGEGLKNWDSDRVSYLQAQESFNHAEEELNQLFSHLSTLELKDPSNPVNWKQLLLNCSEPTLLRTHLRRTLSISDDLVNSLADRLLPLILARSSASSRVSGITTQWQEYGFGEFATLSRAPEVTSELVDKQLAVRYRQELLERYSGKPWESKLLVAHAFALAGLFQRL